MGKKSHKFDYFDQFEKQTEIAIEEADLLIEALENFTKADDLEPYMERAHQIEHRGDAVNHAILENVATDFITPIEREDIIELSHHIDDVTDKVEEVLIRVYINNVRVIPDEALKLLDIVCKCCEEVENLLKEFADFKHSKSLRDKIISINTLEEEADALYISSMRKLHTEDNDVLHIIAWSEVYSYMEKCADACEHVADTVGSVVMKNS